MGRIEFDGQGVRIPAIALPPFGSNSDLPPTVLTFTENAEFSVDQYRALGFTHYEVSCVGAAGGRGGDATSTSSYVAESVQRPVPQEVWNLQIELEAIADYFWQLGERFLNPSLPPAQYNRAYGIISNSPPYFGPYGSGPPGFYQFIEAHGGMVLGNLWTPAQAYEVNHPQHLMTFVTYRYAFLYPTIEGLGGAGGGGGLHKISGALADLPDVVPVVVGKAGVDAEYAQVKQPYPWTPTPPAYVKSINYNEYGIRREDINAYLSAYRTSYPLPQTTFSGNPVKGEDGGASSFGEVSKASGGIGGEPGMVWDGTKFVSNGNGGAGGIGGRLAAGGGAAGSVAEGVNGVDGIWHPDTGIGAGGGGGKAGRAPTSGDYDPRPGPPRSVIYHLASAGGQGSYSFADTSVYGVRQFRQPWTYLKPVVNGNVYSDYTFSYTGVTWVPATDPSNLVTPGGGGGARPATNLKVGSRATGYSPNGVVVLRLVKI